MKEIRLIRLDLKDFKGFTFTFEPQGQDTDIFGANATGKTTLADAFAWLLFDKDSLGRSDFEIKNLDTQGEAEHGLEHAVEAVLDVKGAMVTLRKVYHEIWSKKRGSAKAVFTGNTTDYYLNSVPVQKKDYVDAIAELAGEESIFRLLTTPTAFPSLHWQKQRALLMEVCGGVSDIEVLDSMATLTNKTEIGTLTTIINQRSLDDHKKIVTARRTEINRELDKLPVRIDEVRRGLPDVTGLNRDGISDEIWRLEESLNGAKLRLSGIDNGGTIAELSKRSQELRHDINELENKYYLEGMRHVTQMNARINELTAGKQNKDIQINNAKATIENNQKRIAGLENQLQSLREKWTAIDAEEFKNNTEDTCPACGQALPTERVMEAFDKALAQFNQSKAERLLEIETKGKELRGELDRTIPDIERLHASLMELQAVGEDDQYSMLIEERDILKARAEDYTQIPGRAEMLEQRADIERRIQEARNGLSQDKDAIQNEINNLNEVLKEAKEKIDRFTRREQGNLRIEELKNSEKLLTAEFERLEQELYLCEQFIKAKVAMLTDKINGLFQIARFKLFDVQVNGGISECCEITVNGIPFNSGLNNAARINAGLDVCRTLSRHYGLIAPIFVDNAESVCELITMDAQVVRLVVSEQDKALRVETGKKRMAA